MAGAVCIAQVRGEELDATARSPAAHAPVRARLVLLPTLTVFLLQRHWVSRWSYVSVTGKPSGRMLCTTEWYMRWPCILGTYGAMFLIVALYMTIIVGLLTKV